MADRELGHGWPAVRGVQAPGLKGRQEVGNRHEPSDIGWESKRGSPRELGNRSGLGRGRRAPGP
eukprot:9349667-Alexandrium_andersonii.AAC.1